MAIIIGDVSGGKQALIDLHTTLKTELQGLTDTLGDLKTHWKDEKSSGYITSWESTITNVLSVANTNLPILDEKIGQLDELVHIYSSEA